MTTRTFTSMADHTKDGKLDWDSYRAAQVANGEKCSRCGAYTGIGFGSGHQDLCDGCKEFASEKSEVSHESRVRCPHCRTDADAFEDPPGDIFDDGEHDVTCWHCGREFVVETRVSYEFTSRPTED